MSVIIRNQQKYEGVYKSSENVENVKNAYNEEDRVILGARKILMYIEVHEFFETAQSCFSYPLYELLQISFL